MDVIFPAILRTPFETSYLNAFQAFPERGVLQVPLLNQDSCLQLQSMAEIGGADRRRFFNQVVGLAVQLLEVKATPKRPYRVDAGGVAWEMSSLEFGRYGVSVNLLGRQGERAREIGFRLLHHKRFSLDVSVKHSSPSGSFASLGYELLEDMNTAPLPMIAGTYASLGFNGGDLSGLSRFLGLDFEVPASFLGAMVLEFLGGSVVVTSEGDDGEMSALDLSAINRYSDIRILGNGTQGLRVELRPRDGVYGRPLDAAALSLWKLAAGRLD